MTMNSPHLRLPDPNNDDDVQRHKAAVLDKFRAMFDLADSALRDSIPKAKNLFALFGGNPDRAVHAMNTRYLMKIFLKANEVSADEQSPTADLNIEWVPNCGLFVKLPDAEIRILKAAPLGVPKPTSTARSRYYSSNQMLLAFETGSDTAPNLPLVLVLLWDIDDDFNYVGLDVACPRSINSDGKVDCFWITKWTGSEPQAAPVPPEPGRPSLDLEGIAPMESGKSKAAKA